MKTLFAQISVGGVGWMATITAEDNDKKFAAWATGIWFITQTVVLIWDRVKRRNQDKEGK